MPTQIVTCAMSICFRGCSSCADSEARAQGARVREDLADVLHVPRLLVVADLEHERVATAAQAVRTHEHTAVPETRGPLGAVDPRHDRAPGDPRARVGGGDRDGSASLHA